MGKISLTEMFIGLSVFVIIVMLIDIVHTNRLLLERTLTCQDQVDFAMELNDNIAEIRDRLGMNGKVVAPTCLNLDYYKDEGKGTQKL